MDLVHEVWAWYELCIERISEYSELEGTRKDNWVQLLALTGHPKNPIMCLGALSKCFWAPPSLGLWSGESVPVPKFPLGIKPCPSKYNLLRAWPIPNGCQSWKALAGLCSLNFRSLPSSFCSLVPQEEQLGFGRDSQCWWFPTHRRFLPIFCRFGSLLG